MMMCCDKFRCVAFMRHLGLICSVFALICSLGCCSHVVQISNPNASLELSAEQVTAYQKDAQSGDATAAWKLYLYYNIARNDPENGLRWLTKSAEYGNPNAQYNLGCTYLNLQDTAKAKFWFQRAADSGSAEAKIRLTELDVNLPK
jgi:TPR repeat protein